jgi:hypothetical protein
MLKTAFLSTQPIAFWLPPLQAMAKVPDMPDIETAGTLKLPPADAEDYRKALKHYDIDSSGAFLRKCAYALIRHMKAGDELPRTRLSFKTTKNIRHHE